MMLRSVFIGPNGVRAGWRLAAYILIAFALFRATGYLIGLATLDDDTRWLVNEFVTFVDLVVAALIVGRFEKRSLGTYGLPWQKAFRLRFWQGAGIGFASITLLLCALAASGVFRFGSLALHGGAIVQWAAIYALVFLIVGLKEEFFARGYTLYTLASGIWFWPAALITSAYFGYSHVGNSGEDLIGVANAGLFGLLFCFMLTRTGDLWLPIGFHAAWDWGESYFYGVADSGNTLPGHLLQPSTSGVGWLSGGSVGPEGSILCTVVLIVIAVAFHMLFPKAVQRST